MKTTNCEKVLSILKDRKPHLNREMWDRLGGGFALAARIRNLREMGYHIKSGPPQKFNIKRQKQGDWYYQLLVPMSYSERCKAEGYNTHLTEKDITSGKLLTKSFMRTHSKKLDRILA